MSTEYDKKTPPMDEQADWVMSFVDHAREEMQELRDIWEETELNFLVRPRSDQPVSSMTDRPLASYVTEFLAGSRRGYSSVLKDPETHQEVMTIASKIVLALFPHRSPFVAASGIGFEDIFKASITSGLIQHDFRLEGQFWNALCWILSLGIYGTGIMEAFWDYREEPRSIRLLDVDPLTGERRATASILTVPVWDDPRLSCVHVRDFFPDPSQSLLSRMLGAATRFRLTARRANEMADAGIYDTEEVNKAVAHQHKLDSREQEDRSGDQVSGTNPREAHSSFCEMRTYRYIGETPWKRSDDFTKREIVVCNGRTIRNEVWARRLPWFECKAIPRGDSFWGISPAEVIRHDQDFADTLKMMLADAVVRMTHPSPVVNKFANPDYERLRRPRPDIPIKVEGDPNGAIAWPNFNPPIGPAFEMYAGTKQQMREGSGALGAVQGLGLGSKRFSASEAQLTFNQAMDRPELFATVVEREFLPPVGRYILGLYQEFLEDDPREISRRVGETTFPVDLSDIMGDYDIEFIGSRQQSPQRRIEAFREIVAASANPMISGLIPWIPLLREHFRALGADEIAAMVGNPQMVQIHMLLQGLMGGSGQNAMSGNQNGTTPSGPPLGALPAQLAGGAGSEPS